MSTHALSSPIGLICIGLLGTALGERLLSAGFSVCGFDVSPERRAAFVEIGSEAVDAPSFVANRAKRIVLSLPNSDIVESVVADLLPHLSAGSILIDTTTGDPERTAALGERLAQANIGYLDATVAGSSEQARRGDVIVMAGGPVATLAACQDVLASFAKQVFHVGPWGSGARMKLVVNLVLGLNRAVLAEGLVLAKSAGLDPAAALEVLRAGPAYSTVMDTKGPKMLSSDFEPQARLGQHLKDVRLILELGERIGAGLPLSTLHRQLLESAVDLGLADADNCAIIKAMERVTN